MRFNNEESSAVHRFLESWTKQLGRSIQAFSGEQPTITWSRVEELPAGEAEDVFWWKQKVEGASNFTVAIGAHESTWTAVGSASEDMDADDAKAAYLEILAKTQRGTAVVLSAGLAQTLQCRKGQVCSAPKGDTNIYALVGITICGEQLPALLFSAEPSMAEALGSLVEVEATRERGLLPAGPTGGLMLNRLLTLDLPISVALGRTELPIRELLKTVSGSVVELDQEVDDYADVIVHGTVVARGEIVSVRGNYGIRIKEVISQEDRIDLYRRG